MNFVECDVYEGKIKIEGVDFVLPQEINKDKVIVGIRAEKMTTGSMSINVPTDIVEMTGGERNVYFNLNGSKCVAKVPLDYACTDTVELKISVEDMYFFDCETGANLLYK